MPALNFKKRFAPKVESGEKCQTIRAYRKDGRDPKKDDILYLYTGMRTKGCRKIKEAACVETYNVIIHEKNLYFESLLMSAGARKTIAILDGFKNYQEFQKFFAETHGLPFYGLLIKW